MAPALPWDEILSRSADALADASTEAEVRKALETALQEAFPDAPAAPFAFPLPPPANPLAIGIRPPEEALASPGVRTLSRLAGAALTRLAASSELAGLRDRFERLRSAGRAVASSLDYASALEGLPHVFVPALADWCTLKVVEPDGRSHALAAHADPARIGFLREFAVGPSGRLTDEVRASLARGEIVHRARTRDVLAEPGDGAFIELLGSCVVLGLSVRGRVFGALALGRASPEGWDAEHLAMAEDIAHRAALAVDNARLYREALEATKVRDEFISIASHELRTPLTALKLDVQLASRTANNLAGPGNIPRRLDDALKQVNRLTSLVTELLDVSRISAGRLEIEVEEVDLVSLAAGVADRFEAEAALIGTRIELDAAGPLLARVDGLRIDQVLTNLVSNALKYGNNTPVRVRVSADERRVLVEVADRGIGIPPEAQGRIFERFTRAAPKGHAGGLGLGLWIAREIVLAHRGVLTVESGAANGTVFRIELPRWAS